MVGRMNKHPTHETHPAIIKRLKRANGHLQKVIGMIEDERSCLELAQQLHAVEAAICAARKALIHDHIDHCLDDAAHSKKGGHASLDEFKQITKYL